MNRTRALRYFLFVSLTAAIGLVVWDLGQRGAQAYERMLKEKILNGLDVLGYTWAEVRTDGLRVELHGHAPDSFARDLAYESARATAPVARIANFATATLAPPERRDPVRVELHRDQRGITMTGQTASRTMRDGLNAALSEIAPDVNVRDLTGIQAALPKRRMTPEMQIAALSAVRLPNAYVVMEPGSVTVEGQSQDEADREDLTRTLLQIANDKVALELKVRIPADVIAPFAFSAFKDAGRPLRVERCAVRSAEERAEITRRLQAARVENRSGLCRVGLGGPGGDWPAAVAAALDALEALPAGRVDVEYRFVRLDADAPSTKQTFETVRAAFLEALPEGYEGAARLRGDDFVTRVGIARERFWMHLARTDDGVTIAGQVPHRSAQQAIETHAQVLFGATPVTTSLRVSDHFAPAHWQTIATRLLDYLSIASDGEARLAGHRAILDATVDDPVVAAEIHRDLTGLFSDYEVATTMRVDLPSRMDEVPLPGPRCADKLNRVNHGAPVDFDSGSARITKSSRPIVARLASILMRCDAKRIEVGGHTDSQGSDQVNERISQARADAVVAALLARGVPQRLLTSKGYGSSTPIASNGTPEGRALNRRIEFLPVE